MKKLLLTFLILSSLHLFVEAQTNLVQNPSFEIYDTCPTSDCQIQYATGWGRYRECTDYFNSCATFASGQSAPYNAGGFQYAATGNGYGGEYFTALGSIFNREAIGSTLSSSLIIGTKYYVTFKVSLSCIDTNLGASCAVNKIGALFSTVQYNHLRAPSPINNFAQVYTDSIISDTLNWATIRGSFIADSIYKYIAIGNFFSDANTEKKYFFKGGGNDTAAFYYIDDVCVSTDSDYCETCWTGISGADEKPSFEILPNPAHDYFKVKSDDNNNLFEITIYNVLGQKLYYKENIKQEEIAIDIKGFNENILIINIKTRNQNFNYKLLKL